MASGTPLQRGPECLDIASQAVPEPLEEEHAEDFSCSPFVVHRVHLVQSTLCTDACGFLVRKHLSRRSQASQARPVD